MPWSKVFTFDDPLPYQSTIYTADVELIPTTRGQFFGELTQVRLQKVWMQRYFMSLPQIHIVANRSGRTIFTFLTEDRSPALQHRGMDLSLGEVAVSTVGVVHQRSAADLQHGTMSLADDELRLSYKAIRRPEDRTD